MECLGMYLECLPYTCKDLSSTAKHNLRVFFSKGYLMGGKAVEKTRYSSKGFLNFSSQLPCGVSGGSDALFWPLLVLHSHLHTHT